MNTGRRVRSCLVALALLSFARVDARQASSSVPIPLDVPGRADATPWIAASGSFVAVAWGASAAGKSDVFLAVSRDGGSTFGAPVRVNAVEGEARLGGELPPRVAVTRRSGAAAADVVVLWTARGENIEIRIARSRDGGRTFAAPATLQSPGAPGDRGWPAVALDRLANAHAVWLDHRGLAAARTAGASGASGATHHTSGGADHDGAAMAQKSGLYYASLASRALPERRLTTGVCYCCKTALAAGPDGSLYAAWRHVYPGNLRDMAFTTSRDGGRTFSTPVRVSEDKWAIDGCPDDGPAMAVDARGAHLVWPTVIGGTTPEGALYYASTRDGRSFTPRVRIPTLGGPRPSHPQIVLDAGGRVFVGWDEIVGGRRVAAMRELKPRASGVPEFGEIVMLSPNGPAMYPVLAATDKGLVAVWTTAGEPSHVEVRKVQVP